MYRSNHFASGKDGAAARGGSSKFSRSHLGSHLGPDQTLTKREVPGARKDGAGGHRLTHPPLSPPPSFMADREASHQGQQGHIQRTAPLNCSPVQPQAVQRFSPPPLGIVEAGARSAIDDTPTTGHGDAIAASSYRDEQISELFSAMGQASKLSSCQLAQQLQTSEQLITALEEGALGLLPEWEQLANVIANYASFMNVDDRPILRRLREKLTEYHLTHLSCSQLDDGLNNPAIMPRSKDSLKAFAENRLSNEQAGNHESTSSILVTSDRLPHSEGQGGVTYNGTPPPPLPVETWPHHRQDEHLKQMMQTAGQQLQSYQQAGQYSSSGSLADVPYPAYQQDQAQFYKKPFPYLKLVSNIAFVLILLFGFIHWQPNRFWSGVDQLPKPISNTIYGLFEYVMPDPLAATYRMNWVFVDDPRLRKADRLPVAKVKALPPIDFSNLGSFSP